MTGLHSSLLHRLDLCGQCAALSLSVLFYSTERRWLNQLGAMLSLLLIGLPAQAIDYTFSPLGILPASCSINLLSVSSYTCGAVSFAAGDTVTIGLIKPVTVTFNGAVTLGAGVFINSEGATSDLALVVDGAVTLGASSTVKANLQTLNAGAVTIGANSWLSGDLSTDTGFVVIGAATIPTPLPPAAPQTGVGGNVSTITGYISMGADSVVNGSVTTQDAGYVVLGANAKVGGPVTTLGAGYVVLGASAEVGGSITASGITGADYVTTGVGSIVNGNISAVGSYITLGASTEVSGNVSTQNSYISVGATSTVGGQITTNDTVSAINIGASSLVYAVCCNGAGSECVVDGSGIMPGPLVCPSLTESVAASFTCLETGTNSPWDAAARRPLYTKLASTNFTLDIAALNAQGSRETNYVASGGAAKTVTLELVDGSGTVACASRMAISSAPLTLNFADTDFGRKSSGNIAVNKAYSNLRCRLTDANQATNVVACSTDNFAVRPLGFVVNSIDANADATGVSLTASPIIKAGAAFSLSAASLAGYNGTPVLDASSVAAHPAASANGTLSGAFSAADEATGIAAASSFTYSEVGYFRLGVNSLIDSSFTSVDQFNNDCSNDFSNTLVGGKYGCKFGNTDATSYFGRFIPDHFDVVVAQGCSAGDFTYSGQPFTVTVTAKNGFATPATTVNYSSSATENFAKPLTLSDTNEVAGGSLAPTSIMASTFSFGVAKPTPAFTFSSATTLPAIIKLHAVDTDNVSSTTYESAAITTIRSGRVRLLNAFGSELLDLPMTLRAEYWQDASNGWQTNAADSCSDATLLFSAVNTLDITGNTCVWDAGTSPGNSAKGCVGAPPGGRQYREVGVVGFAGDFNLWLKASGDGHAGSIDVTVTVPDWLQHNWTGVIANPIGRATFGVYKSGSDQVIHRLERY